MSKIKNIIIFTSITVVFILIYIFFIKPEPVTENLVSTPSNAALPDIVDIGSNMNMENKSSFIAKDFLSLLLNVKNIKLDDTIFSEVAFDSLRDSSIVLVPDGNEGRPNPFAQLGSDKVVPTSPTSPVTPTPIDSSIPVNIPAGTNTTSQPIN